MKRCIVAALAALLIFVAPAVPKEKSDYIAVYSDPGFVKYWSPYKVNYIQEAKTWDDFPGFIKRVKEESQESNIILDINVHGTPGGLLCISHDEAKCEHGTPNKSYLASVGYLLKEISELGEDRVRVVILESCYGGYVYHASKTGHGKRYTGGHRFDSYKEETPYQILGVDNCISWNNVVFLQFLNRDTVNIHDLRTYSTTPPPGGLEARGGPKTKALYWYLQYRRQDLVNKYLRNMLKLDK